MVSARPAPAWARGVRWRFRPRPILVAAPREQGRLFTAPMARGKTAAAPRPPGMLVPAPKISGEDSCGLDNTGEGRRCIGDARCAAARKGESLCSAKGMGEGLRGIATARDFVCRKYEGSSPRRREHRGFSHAGDVRPGPDSFRGRLPRPRRYGGSFLKRRNHGGCSSRRRENRGGSLQHRWHGGEVAAAPRPPKTLPVARDEVRRAGRTRRAVADSVRTPCHSVRTPGRSPTASA